MTENKSYLFKSKASGINTYANLRFYFLISITIFVLDQLSKRLIEYGTIKISYIYNEGAALGLFRSLSPDIRIPIFIAISILAVIVIFYYMFTIDLDERLITLSLAMILGGALGNFIDRLLFGKVLDFIDVGFWPTFNIADSAISVGVCLLLFKTFFPGKEKEEENENKIEAERRTK